MTYFTTVFASILIAGSVSALSSSSRVTTRMTIDVPKFNPKTYPGVAEPVGFFDPLNLSGGLTETQFKKYRESEIKHGRVAMLAFLGIFLAEALPIIHKIQGPAIYHFQQADSVLNAFTANVIGFTAAIEGYNIIKGWQPIDKTIAEPTAVADLRDDYEPGNLNWDPLEFKPTSPKALSNIKTKELNNGRLAMIGVAGIVVQELITNKPIF